MIHYSIDIEIEKRSIYFKKINCLIYQMFVFVCKLCLVSFAMKIISMIWTYIKSGVIVNSLKKWLNSIKKELRI